MALQPIVVKSTRGDTYRGTLSTLKAPVAVIRAIANQTAAGHDRGQVNHGGHEFTWHAADIFDVRQFTDGTWFVIDLVENLKTHDGYFATRAEAEAELEAIFAGDGRGPAVNVLVA